MSVASNDIRTTGLTRVLSHLSKPLAITINPNQRDDPQLRERSLRHLNRVNQNNVTRAMYEEPAILYTQSQMNKVEQILLNLVSDMEKIKSEGSTAIRSKIEKKAAIYPNRDDTYPPDNQPVDENTMSRAYAAFGLQVKVVERSYTFKDSAYNFLLEICSASNIIASQYGLTKMQIGRAHV